MEEQWQEFLQYFITNWEAELMRISGINSGSQQRQPLLGMFFTLTMVTVLSVSINVTLCHLPYYALFNDLSQTYNCFLRLAGDL